MIHYQISKNMPLQDDLENFITEIEGTIKCKEEDVDIGKIRVTLVDIASAFNLGVPLPNIFQYSRRLYEIYLEVYHEDGKIYSYMENNLSEMRPCHWDNLLIIDSVFIEPKFRKKKLSLAVIYRTIQKFAGGCRLVLLKTIPQNLDSNSFDRSGRVSLNRFSEQECQAIKSLQNFYQKIGFEKVPETAYMVLDLELKQPNLEDIGFRN